jgi:glycosyltransferase involved in cell wall biosynthesis
LIRALYYKLKRSDYLLRKLVKSSGKRLVVYTKNHPIYTATFEEGDFPKSVFAYVDINKPLSWLERQVISRSKLLHIDAATYYSHSFDKPELFTKPVVLECEGRPRDEYLTDERLNKILLESIAAGREFYNKYDKVALSYPSLIPKNKVEQTDKEYITILSVGYGGYIKGYDVLYRIYKTLSQRYKIKLIIAGSFGHDFGFYPEVKPESYERENFDAINAELQADPNVTFRPVKRDELLNNVYHLADIYVQFSRMETFGFSILEALSFGLPVVACDFKAIPEMVDHGVNGFLVSSNGFDYERNDYVVDINDVKWGNNCYEEGLAYIEDLVKSTGLRKQMSAKAYEKVEQTDFNTRNRVVFLEQLYDKYVKA